MSQLLFNLLINDLVLCIKAIGRGVMIDGDVLNILLYVDDVLLVSENAENLQNMLNCLNE